MKPQKVTIVKTMQVREAKAGFSALVQAAENGEPTTITKHGRRAAVIVPVADADKIYPTKKKNFGAFLLEYPGGVELERNPSPSRDIDL